MNPSYAPEPSRMMCQIDGRDVLLIAPERFRDQVFDELDHAGIAAGEYALLVQGEPPESVLEIVAALPDELPDD